MRLQIDNLEPLLATFMEKAQEVTNRTYRQFMPEERAPHMFPPKLTMEEGSRYIRIVSTDVDKDGNPREYSRRVWGFVDKVNGDVLKAATWKAPAKNFARGNIADANNGLGRASWTGVS